MSKLTMAILVSSLALAVGCDIGPISHESVVNSLSRYASESVARRMLSSTCMWSMDGVGMFHSMCDATR